MSKDKRKDLSTALIKNDNSGGNSVQPLPGADWLNKIPTTLQSDIIMNDDGTVNLGACQANAAGLDVPTDVTPTEINQTATLLFAIEGRVQLWIGDLLNAAENLEYGAIKAIAEKFGRDPDTLYNWRSLALAVTISLRSEVLSLFPDSKPLSKSHYEIIRKLPEKSQREWCILAMENEWSVAEMREAFKGKKTGKTQFDRLVSHLTPFSKVEADDLSNSERLQILQYLEELVEKYQD